MFFIHYDLNKILTGFPYNIFYFLKKDYKCEWDKLHNELQNDSKLWGLRLTRPTAELRKKKRCTHDSCILLMDLLGFSLFWFWTDISLNLFGLWNDLWMLLILLLLHYHSHSRILYFILGGNFRLWFS